MKTYSKLKNLDIDLYSLLKKHAHYFNYQGRTSRQALSHFYFSLVFMALSIMAMLSVFSVLCAIHGYPLKFSFSLGFFSFSFYTEIYVDSLSGAISSILWNTIKAPFVIIPFALKLIVAALFITFIVNMICIHIRRLHDYNLSGYWLFPIAVTEIVMLRTLTLPAFSIFTIALILHCIIWLLPGSRHENTFGPPKPFKTKQ